MVESCSQKIFLLRSDKKSETKFIGICTSEKIHHWMYFGKKVTTALEIEKFIGARAIKIEIGEELQKNARQFRQEYVDYLGRCAVDNGTPCWYLTSLSEKNLYVSDFYLNFCYIKSLINLVKENKGNFCIFCESRFLIDSIKKNLDNIPGYDVVIYDRALAPCWERLFYSFIPSEPRIVHITFFITDPPRQDSAYNPWECSLFRQRETNCGHTFLGR
jgi:hypothetical protein